jgi:hypothetical protein
MNKDDKFTARTPCPICDSPAYQGLGQFHCSNSNCKLYDKSIDIPISNMDSIINQKDVFLILEQSSDSWMPRGK